VDPNVDQHGSEDLVAAIRGEIARDGAIGFERFMEISLYDPGGFFDQPPVGAHEHFVTSPHVSPFVFSRCVRGALVDSWFALGEPEPFRVVELGAGDGTLASALLEAFGELPRPSVDHIGVEIAAGARDRLAERGLASVGTIDELEPFEGAVFANELLDNVPFALARREGRNVVEIRVGASEDGFRRVAVPWSDERLEPERVPPSTELERAIPVRLPALARSLADRLVRGYVILVDYADGGGVRGFRRHREVDDVLLELPGTTDITTGIDAELVAELARDVGLLAWDPVSQADALRALGYERWERSVRETQTRLQTEGDSLGALRTWEMRSRTSLLVDRSHLGNLWWLVLATPGLPEPDWLGRARNGPDGGSTVGPLEG
jgi:NADH dehydrogenase [ubiquinone] 1 alpha subcomplex assembly factor 7